jgi:hypothetical protein
LGSDPLEHAFGRGRIGCRVVNTIKEMINLFTAYAWNASIDKSLRRILDSRRRACIELECEPWSHSAVSVLENSPKIIVILLLTQARFKVHGDFTMGFDSGNAWQEPFKISGFLRASADIPSTRPVIAECKQHSKILTWNEVFPGITGCSTQTVASRDRRLDRSHTVGMCKYKTKSSFSLKQISLIFFGRFYALNVSVLRSTHRDRH